MKYWIYYILAVIFLLHPHLSQKIEMLVNYFSHPEYEFWTTFSIMDVLDLILHLGLPMILILFGIRKQRRKRSE